MKNDSPKFSKMINRLFSVNTSNNLATDQQLNNEDDYTTLINELKLNHKHLTHAQQIAKTGSWEYIIEEDALYCSDYFYSIFGLDSKEHISMDKPFELIHPEDYEHSKKILENAYKGVNYATEFRIYHGKTGELCYIKVQAEVIFKNKKPYKLVGMIQDNTKEKQLEHELRDTNESFDHIFNNLSSGIWMKELDSSNITYLSKGTEEIFELPLEEIYQNPTIWESVIHPDDREAVFNLQQELLAGNAIKHRYRIITHNGKIKWVFDQTIPWFNKETDINRLFGIIVDVTSEMEMQEELNFYASHDHLTRLPNKRSLYNHMNRLIEEKQPFTVFYLDLDRFTLINNSLGYEVGDSVLKIIAERLKELLPTTGYVARLVSNDFVIIDTTATKDQSQNLATRILNEIDKEVRVLDYQLNVTTSIGISFFPEDGGSELTLLESAHTALYQAKKSGKNTYQVYAVTESISAYKQYTLEQDLRKAISNDEFEVYYHPQVNGLNGLIESAEALIRWNHKEWGLVSPAEFIPFAEENHLMNEIGDWVIRNVIKQLAIWKDKGYILRPISINISPTRFLKPGLVTFVKKLLETHKISAHYLEFEITESTILKNEPKIIKTLDEIRELGITIAIDDFGTGYATLQYLLNISADTLKIDRMFIQNITNQNKNDAAIVTSILYLAKALNMKVIAEGVEEVEQLQLLIQKECFNIQGYLFSKPVPNATFEKLINKGFFPIPKSEKTKKPEVERRKYYRLELPGSLKAELSIVEINNKRINVGSAKILIENISLGGLKIMSGLKLPVQSNMKVIYNFTLMDQSFEIEGSLVWKYEVRQDIFYYGVAFNNFPETDKDHLARLINQITVTLKNNQDIPSTNFVTENPITYLLNNN
ncbi:hypothetical protein GCM10011351_05140 [Paraliobacillus quinghaiensis]|uniref:EAL domain-containing protein n=1 Tax=Paraliobacillus quinghaiensis TaxID=470815 RepID=A0A917TGX4_9BACI|nr:EAL domain-containing protein [Paraliobacillus quinghaiensis]GGM22229.1 hypothetical protein GCM10011351_05140 [Paraliobacillus quinghaiensis]